MKEYDLRLEAKKNAEFITPEKLRYFIASKVNKKNITVLDPAIGSGQLLFKIDDIKSIDGFDINIHSLNCAKENFHSINIYNDDFITYDVTNEYDYAISNYPFSIKPSDNQKEYIKNDSFLSSFYNKDITGVLDFIFILKSFSKAKEGLYFCFPGIGYRKQEEKFRKYLIENKLIREYGVIRNCKFEHTSISLLFLHLTKEKNESVNSFNLDLEKNEIIEQEADFNDFNFNTPPSKIEEKEEVDPFLLEKNIRDSLINNIKSQIKVSFLLEELDSNKKTESVLDYIDRIIFELQAIKKK